MTTRVFFITNFQVVHSILISTLFSFNPTVRVEFLSPFSTWCYTCQPSSSSSFSTSGWGRSSFRSWAALGSFTTWALRTASLRIPSFSFSPFGYPSLAVRSDFCETVSTFLFETVIEICRHWFCVRDSDQTSRTLTSLLIHHQRLTLPAEFISWLTVPSMMLLVGIDLTKLHHRSLGHLFMPPFK
jgi:hypothetical protein